MDSQVTQDRPTFARRVIRAICREWIAWALLWCVARGLLLVCFADVFGYGEEMEKACAAKAMLDGLPVPHYQLAYHYYEGGGFVISHLDAVAFALLGESLLAIKVVSLALGAAILGAGWRLCERFAGRWAARAFSLLFIFAPASVQKLSLLTLGIHFHALLFVALVLDVTAQIILERNQRPRTWLRLGVLAGFGLFFSYQLVLTIIVAALALVITFRAELFRRATLAALAGLAIGLLPMLWMFVHVGSAVFDIHGAEVVGEAGGAKLHLLQEFLASIFSDRSAFDWIALSALCLSPLLGFFAFATSSPRNLRVGAWIVLAHIGLFLFAYIASGFTVGRVYHYFVLSRLTPLWWLVSLFGVLGAVAAWNSRSRWKQAIAGVCIAVLSICGAADLGQMMRDALSVQSRFALADLPKENLRILARTKGYAYPEYLHKISAHLDGDTANKLRAFLNFRELPGIATPPRSTLLEEGIAAALYGDGARTLEAIQLELSAAGISDPRGFYLGFGSFLRNKFPPDIAARVRGVETYPAEVQEPMIEAVGCSGLGMLATEDRVAKEIQMGLDAKLPASYFEGLGRRMHDARGNRALQHYFDPSTVPWMLERDRAETFIRAQPQSVVDALRRGYHSAHHDHWINPQPWWM